VSASALEALTVLREAASAWPQPNKYDDAIAILEVTLKSHPPVKWREYLDAVARLENDGGTQRSGEAIDRDIETVRAWDEWASRQ
jgi:hypothetical protein